MTTDLQQVIADVVKFRDWYCFRQTEKQPFDSRQVFIMLSDLAAFAEKSAWHNEAMRCAGITFAGAVTKHGRGDVSPQKITARAVKVVRANPPGNSTLSGGVENRGHAKPNQPRITRINTDNFQKENSESVLSVQSVVKKLRRKAKK